MSNLITKLESLTDEELAKVESLINRLGNKNEDNPPEKKRRQRRGGGGKKREEVEEPEEDDDYGRSRRKSGRRRERDFDIREHRQGRRGGRGSERAGTKLARVEPMDLSGRRPNLFKERGFDKLHKTDTKIDKLLIGNNQRTRREESRLITVRCVDCDKKCKVSPQVINDDGRYRCDNCVDNR